MPLFRRWRWYRGPRRFWRRRRRRLLRRMLLGAAVLFLVSGAATTYKLRRRDIAQIERETGKSTDKMTEEELKMAMRRLGIQKLELTDEDWSAIRAAKKDRAVSSAASYCPFCGIGVEASHQFCPNCGAALS